MKAGLDRRLVAVMFTDMVGYTALIQADERAAVAKRDAYWRAVEDQHAAFGGTIVQRLGDGSTSMFPSAMAAVQALGRPCAVDEQGDCGIVKERRRGFVVARGRKGQRGQRILSLRGDPQRRPAAGQDPQARATLDQAGDPRRGSRFVDRARALLSAEQLANATEVGRRLTIKQALDYTRSA